MRQEEIKAERIDCSQDQAEKNLIGDLAYQNKILQFLLIQNPEIFSRNTIEKITISEHQRHLLTKAIYNGQFDALIEDMLTNKMVDLIGTTKTQMREICHAKIELLRREGAQNLVHDRFVDATVAIDDKLAPLKGAIGNLNNEQLKNRDTLYTIIDENHVLNENDRARLMIKVADLLRTANNDTNIIATCENAVRDIVGSSTQVDVTAVLRALRLLFFVIQHHVQVHLQLQTKANQVEKQSSTHPEQTKDTISSRPELIKLGQDINAQIVDLPENRFKQVLVSREPKVITEPLIRVYRGINKIDSAACLAAPYSMRGMDDSEKVVKIDRLEAVSEQLASVPNYENFLKYIEVSRTVLKGADLARLKADQDRIEQAVLAGTPLRRLLIHDQTTHLGGKVTDRGISPYVSASHNIDEAISYILDGALVIMDIPVSQLENYNSEDGETNIKGQVKSSFITAIIPGTGNDFNDRKSLDAALAAINIQTNFKPTSANDGVVLTQLYQDRARIDQEQLAKDQLLIQEKRAQQLTKSFVEVNISLAAMKVEAEMHGNDVLTWTKIRIFDYFAHQFTLLGKKTDLSEFEYMDTEFHKRPFSRDNITEDMLLALSKFIDRQYEMQRQRAA